MMEWVITPSFLLSLGLWVLSVASAVGFYKHKSAQHDKEIKELKDEKAACDDVSALRGEVENLRKTKGTVFERLGEINGDVIALKKDVEFASKVSNEIQQRLYGSVQQFQVDLVRTEGRILQHVDSSLAALSASMTTMKDIVKDALAARAHERRNNEKD